MHLHLTALAAPVNMDVIASMSSRPPPTGPMPSPAAVRAWVNLMRAQRLALANIEHELKAAGLPPLGWYDVLLELVRSENGKLRPYEIEERILLEQHNLSRLLDRMEKQGLVRREAFEEDGRGRWVVVTDAGRAMQSRMWSVYGPAIQKHVGTKLGKASAAQLADLLATLARQS